MKTTWRRGCPHPWHSIPAAVPRITHRTASPHCQICPVTNALFNSGPNDALIDDALERQRGRDWYEIESDLDGREKVENTFFANITTWDIGENLTLKNIFGYRDLDYSAHNDTDGTWLPLFGTQTEGNHTNIGTITPLPRSPGPPWTRSSTAMNCSCRAFPSTIAWTGSSASFTSDMDGSQSHAHPDYPDSPAELAPG